MLDRLWSIYVVIGCKFTQALDIKYQFILQLQFYSTYISISISYYFTVYFHFIIIYQLFCRLHTASQPKEHIFTLIYFYIYPRSLPYYRVAKWEELFCAKSHIDLSDQNVIHSWISLKLKVAYTEGSEEAFTENSGVENNETRLNRRGGCFWITISVTLSSCWGRLSKRQWLFDLPDEAERQVAHPVLEHFVKMFILGNSEQVLPVTCFTCSGKERKSEMCQSVLRYRGAVSVETNLCAWFLSCSGGLQLSPCSLL